MRDNYSKFRNLLQELFQLDQADLDFGIYRIMNQKRDEITHFLEDDLLPQVQEAFKEYRSSDRSQIENQLNETIQQATALGVDPESSPKVEELREKLASSVDVSTLENEVFSDLYDFFRRYYNEGDFLSLRRYKEGVYAIPYEGEEVKLHWANHDQYYIKTSEYLRDYTFKLPSGKCVHFKLAEADTEKDNTKAQNGQERRFVLYQDTPPLAEENSELLIRFEYRPDPDKSSQKDLNLKTIQTIMNTKNFSQWLAELAQLRPTEKNPSRTLLEKHLTDYTARNTFDYFIHKGLGGFLRRELDFFIKNEVMHLDDIEHESAPRVEQYLSKIKVIRKIAHKIIQFLAQIEDFQKKLWLKKKFVVETNYCITLDRIPEELYPEIAANDAQREEWVRLFAIDEIKEDMLKPAYSNPLTVEFLKANPYLLIDTGFFEQEFKNRLLASFDDVDDKSDGLLVHSENFQALSLLLNRYREKVKCIYMDPPFNSKTTEILYKNYYKHSSWLSLMENRILRGDELLEDKGVLICAIDENEQERLGLLLELLFPSHEKTCVAIIHNPGGIQGQNFSFSHEYAYFVFPRDGEYIGKIQRDKADRVPLRDWGGEESKRENARNCFYPIKVKGDQIIEFGEICPDDFHPSSANIENDDSTISIYPIDNSGVERKWRHARQTIEKIKDQLKCEDIGNEKVIIRYKSVYRYKTVWTDSKYNSNVYGSKLLNNMFGEDVFTFPKSLYNVLDCIDATTQNLRSPMIIDFFAGSGTTAHAVINLNNEDDGNRKYILVEMGEYFDTVMKPRVQKVIYSKDWKNGKPVSREGSSHMFKYVRLESYEDTLNNLELRRTEAQQALLDDSESFRESYMLSYMLDVESKDSASLLNIDSFEDPFNYKLKITTGSAGETKPVTVDLVETFNYLIGLTIHHIDHIRGFRVVQGINPKGEKVLIIWRNLNEKSNEDLDEFFRRQEYNPKDLEFDLIYVNSDNNVENLRREDEIWKVYLIEEEFKRLMFDVQDV
ncbi:hypothetical protein ES707_03228 [subsurface metagenome]